MCRRDLRICTYSRPPNAIDISQGSLTCPFLTDTGPSFLYGDSDTPPNLIALYDTLGIRRTYSRLKVRLGYCFTPYQRLWLYNGAPLVAFHDTLGIRRTYSLLKAPVSSRGYSRLKPPASRGLMYYCPFESLLFLYKNKTNHPISSNSHPSTNLSTSVVFMYSSALLSSEKNGIAAL